LSTTEPSTESAFDAAAAEEAQHGDSIEGLGPWRLAARRLRRNYGALFALFVFILVVIACVGAPYYSKHIAHVGPDKNNLTGKFMRHGKSTFVVSPDGRPVGPGFSKRYLLGADKNGRDVMVRILYGGRNSLLVGFGAAIITAIFGVALGLISGYFKGTPDLIIRAWFDILWSFPVVLLAIALGTALAINGLKLGPFNIQGDSLWIPTLILGVVYVPYLGRPIRGQVLALREKEFVESAIAQGMGDTRIMFGEILPNLASTVLVFSTLIVANNILTEAGLSYLGAGIQSPNPSWGNIISEGVDRLSTAPHLAIVPGLAIVITVLSLNIFGDGLRDALDPRAKVRLR
jgi:peptide/nickel transport system permease protein